MVQVAFYPTIPDFVLVLTRPLSTTKQIIPLLYVPIATANLILRRQCTKFVFSLVLGGHTLTFFQHFDAEHSFGCPECDYAFQTEAAMNQV